MTAAKQSSSNGATMSMDRVARHINGLEDRANSLWKDCNKLDTEMSDNEAKIDVTEKELTNLREQERELYDKLEKVWKEKNKHKNNKHRWYRKADTLEEEYAKTYRAYKDADKLVRAFRDFIGDDLRGTKRSASSSSSSQDSAPKRGRNLNNIKAVEGMSKLPSFKKKSAMGLSQSDSADDEVGIKPEAVAVKQEVKKESDGEVKIISATVKESASTRAAFQAPSMTKP